MVSYPLMMFSPGSSGDDDVVDDDDDDDEDDDNDENVDDLYIIGAVRLSVCPSVTETPQNPVYLLLSLSLDLSASQNHNYWPSCLSAIMPIRPSDLCPAFKQFWLVCNTIKKGFCN